MDEIRELEKKVNISIDKIKLIMVQKTKVPEKSAGKEVELSKHLDKLKEENQKLRKYNTVYDIIDKYFPVRYKTYELRKKYMIETLEKQVKVISNKAKFINEQIVEPPTLILRKKKK